MTAAKHTPGPWVLHEIESDTGNFKHLVPAAEICGEVVSLLTAVEHNGQIFAAVYSKNDARRIVACVNACEGLNTDALEGNDNMATFARRMLLQRDELLTALELIKHATAPSHDDGAYHENAYELASAAIAKVLGEQPCASDPVKSDKQTPLSIKDSIQKIVDAAPNPVPLQFNVTCNHCGGEMKIGLGVKA